jgi:predicted dehydrogenase
VSGQTFCKFGNRGLGNGGWGKSEIDPRKPFDVEDFAVAMIKLRSGRTVLLRTSWAANVPRGDENNVLLFGTEAGASVNPLQIVRPEGGGQLVLEPKTLPNLVSQNRIVHFIDVVTGQAKQFVKIEESLSIQRILDAVYESARSGKEVRIGK